MSNPVGRPLKFQSVEELQLLIDSYFLKMDNEKRPYTITGLALALDTFRDVLLDYEEKDEFSNTIRKAKLKCENYAEESLWKPKVASGVIFNLTNNYKRWKQKQEHGFTDKNGNDIAPQPIMNVQKDNVNEQDNKSKQED